MAALSKIETGSWVIDRDSGELVPKGQFYARKYANVPRSSVACPYVVSDGIELQSMADGRTYTSKRAYYDSLKQTSRLTLSARSKRYLHDDRTGHGKRRVQSR